jgi:hypothetical protein
MNTIYHFGDSYGYTENKEPHFVELLSHRIGYEYNCNNSILPGGSNEMILHRLLQKLFEFKPNDILFFNFSYFVRGCFYDKNDNEIKSTNRFYVDGMDENGKILTNEKHMFDIITHLLDYSEDYNRRLFHQFNIIFEQLESRGVKIFYIYNENTEWSDQLLKCGKHIKFDVGFNRWLVDNGYNKHQCCHYTKGVQGQILDHIIPNI